MQKGAINSLGSFIFNSIKPMILGNVDALIKGQVNSQMRTINYQFPESVPPLDAALAVARTKIKERNMDPFRLPDVTRSMENGVTLRLYDGIFKGLASIHRLNMPIIIPRVSEESFEVSIKEINHLPLLITSY